MHIHSLLWYVCRTNKMYRIIFGTFIGKYQIWMMWARAHIWCYLRIYLNLVATLWWCAWRAWYVLKWCEYKSKYRYFQKIWYWWWYHLRMSILVCKKYQHQKDDHIHRKIALSTLSEQKFPGKWRMRCILPLFSFHTIMASASLLTIYWTPLYVIN